MAQISFKKTLLILTYLTVFIKSGLSTSAEMQHKEQSLKEKLIMVYGDSLSAAYGIQPTQGWVHLLGQKLSEKYPSWNIANLSISGQSTGGALAKIDAHLTQLQPNIILIGLGGNDGLRGMPLSIIERNLSKMIKKSKDIGAEVILLGMNLPANYGPAYTAAFHNIYNQLTQKYSLPTVDSFLAPLAGEIRLFQTDGIHPTSDAQPLLLEHIWPTVEKTIRSQQ